MLLPFIFDRIFVLLTCLIIIRLLQAGIRFLKQIMLQISDATRALVISVIPWSQSRKSIEYRTSKYYSKTNSRSTVLRGPGTSETELGGVSGLCRFSLKTVMWCWKSTVTQRTALTYTIRIDTCTA